MLKPNLPDSPLYDPKSKIQKFIFDEDIDKIRFNLKGKDVLYTDPNFVYDLGADQEWRRPTEICKRPIFIDGKPSRFDAIQGEVEDCSLISSFQVLTLYKSLINHVVPSDQDFGPNYTGAFHFRFWRLGNWIDVVIDDRLPVNKKDKTLVFAHSRKGDIFWVPLLEKAYVKATSITPSLLTYDNIGRISPVTALQDLSGGIIEKFYAEHAPPDHATVKKFLKDVGSDRTMMVVCRKNKTPSETDLFRMHAYGITGIYECPKDHPDFPGLILVRIINPWSYWEWNGAWSDTDKAHWGKLDRNIRKKLRFVSKEDGEFWMSEEDFEKYIGRMYVCYLGPGQYRHSRQYEVIDTWKTMTFSGEWVKGISAGGAALSKRHMNPQYRILLKFPENDIDHDNMCTVVIELTHRSKFALKLRPYLAFSIYSLPDSENLPAPLDKTFFEKNKPLNNTDDYDISNENEGRAYLMTTTLKPGKYCIVPFTKEENLESSFLLRVFSESVKELYEHDTKISRCPQIEETQNEPDDRLKIMFSSVTLGEDEIDWIGLQRILETAMKPNQSLFETVTSYFKRLFQSTNVTDDVVFSKDECRSMIAMLDSDHSGKLSFSEFSKLWEKISLWSSIYESHKDETGYVKMSRLRDALGSLGYDINKRTSHSLSYVYSDEQGNISLTDFILCGVTLETVLNNYKKMDLHDQIKFNLEEWVGNTLIV